MHSTHRWNASAVLLIGHALEEILRMYPRRYVQNVRVLEMNHTTIGM